MFNAHRLVTHWVRTPFDLQPGGGYPHGIGSGLQLLMTWNPPPPNWDMVGFNSHRNMIQWVSSPEWAPIPIDLGPSGPQSPSSRDGVGPDPRTRGYQLTPSSGSHSQRCEFLRTPCQEFQGGGRLCIGGLEALADAETYNPAGIGTFVDCRGRDSGRHYTERPVGAAGAWN